MNYSPDLQLAIKAAKSAADLIQSAYGNIQKVEQKGSYNNIVTETDVKAEEAIIKILQDGSKHAVLSEETGSIEGSSGYCWIIDPIDGTNNFSRGIDFFCVSIALMKGDDIQLGVIVNPVNGNCYCAEKDFGAYLNDLQIQVSRVDTLERSTIFVNRGYGEEHKNTYVEVVNELKSHSMRRMGTSALELCHVAKGSVDVFLVSGDMIWDYAAGVIILEEAGGKVTDWNGGKWNQDDAYILGSNSLVHDEIVDRLSGLQKEKIAPKN